MFCFKQSMHHCAQLSVRCVAHPLLIEGCMLGLELLVCITQLQVDAFQLQ